MKYLHVGLLHNRNLLYSIHQRLEWSQRRLQTLSASRISDLLSLRNVLHHAVPQMWTHAISLKNSSARNAKGIRRKKATRATALEAATLYATVVPLKTMKAAQTVATEAEVLEIVNGKI